jgi:DNA-directed RNA polymerase II subunit RPB2
MADYEEGYEYDDYGEEDAGITAEDCWTVISSFFESKGLVSQQLDSFDEFVSTTMQELVEENSQLTLDQNNPPSLDDNPIALRRYEIKFGTVLLSRPAMTEGDGSTQVMLPQEARLRNLTYSSPLYLEMTKKVSIAVDREVPLQELDEDQMEEMNRTGIHPTRLVWENEDGGGEGEKGGEPARVFIGKLPIMLKSKY